MLTRVFLILCCLGILVAGIGCYASVGLDGGYYYGGGYYYSDSPRRHHSHHHHHHHHRYRYHSPYSFRR